MKKAIMFQVLIFIAAWSIMIPDVLEDNTYIFGLIGSYDLVRGNSIWVMLGAMVLSVINIIVWWPKVKVTNTPETTKEDTKSAETDKEKIDRDPKTPDLS